MINEKRVLEKLAGVCRKVTGARRAIFGLKVNERLTVEVDDDGRAAIVFDDHGVFFDVAEWRWHPLPGVALNCKEYPVGTMLVEGAVCYAACLDERYYQTKMVDALAKMEARALAVRLKELDGDVLALLLDESGREGRGEQQRAQRGYPAR